MGWSNVQDTTSQANLMPNIWAAQIEQSAQASLVAQGIVTGFTFDSPGDVFYVPKLTAITCNAAITDGSDVTLTKNTEGVVTLTMAGRECGVFLPWQVEAVSLSGMASAYQYEVAKAIRTDKDYRILTEVASLTTNSVGGAANHVEKSVFLEALKKVRAGNAQPPYYGVFGTDEFDRWFGIDVFVDASKTGTQQAIQNGLAGTIVGAQIYFTSNIYTTGGVNYNFVGGARCLAHAEKVGLTVDLNRIPIKGNGLLIHGKYMDDTAILNDAFGCVYQTAND